MWNITLNIGVYCDLRNKNDCLNSVLHNLTNVQYIWILFSRAARLFYYPNLFHSSLKCSLQWSYALAIMVQRKFSNLKILVNNESTSINSKAKIIFSNKCHYWAQYSIYYYAINTYIVKIIVVAIVYLVVCWFIRHKVRVRAPGQTSKQNTKNIS